jgi:glucose/arabinose dehydrogenase
VERRPSVCGLIPGVRGEQRIWRSAAIAACVVIVVGGCGGGDETTETSEDAPPAKPRIALQEIGEFEEPIALTGAKDGSLYVGERAGVVKRFDPAGEEKPEVVLDISGDVSTEGEGALFSLAHSPKGDEIFVTYSGLDKKLHLEAFVPGEENSRRELLAIDHPNEVHWGGHLEFDDEGRLYLSTGEGGPVAPRPLVSQDPDSPLGKLFRLDPEAAKPDPEMIALGLRNPWQFSIDGTDIWIGDVGDFQQEEVDLASTEVEEPPNYGWPVLEGTAETGVEDKGEPLVEPVLTYERTGKEDDPNCAITGGHIVRDPALEPLVGRYIFADYCRGEIESAKPSGDGLGEPEPTGLELLRIASFAQDADGNSYAVALTGKVYRLVSE